MCAWVRSNYDSWTHIPGMRDCGQQLKKCGQQLKKCGQQLKKCGQQLKKCGLVNNSRSAAWSTTQEFEMQPIVQEADREDYGPLWATTVTTGHYGPLWATFGDVQLSSNLDCNGRCEADYHAMICILTNQRT